MCAAAKPCFLATRVVRSGRGNWKLQLSLMPTCAWSSVCVVVVVTGSPPQAKTSRHQRIFLARVTSSATSLSIWCRGMCIVVVVVVFFVLVVVFVVASPRRSREERKWGGCGGRRLLPPRFFCLLSAISGRTVASPISLGLGLGLGLGLAVLPGPDCISQYSFSDRCTREVLGSKPRFSTKRNLTEPGASFLCPLIVAPRVFSH